MYIKSKHIIIEGSDKAGKSTLVDYLVEKLKMPKKKFSAPEGNPFMEYCDFIINEKTPHVIDRCYMSELTYGPVKRGKSYINPTEKFLLESAAFTNGVMAIYAYDSLETLQKRMVENKETFLLPDEVPFILENFEKEIDSSILRWHYYKVGMEMSRFAALYELYHKEAE